MKVLFKNEAIPLIKRLYHDYIRHYIGLIFAVIGLLLILSASTSLQPLLLQQAFDKVFKEKDITYLTLMPIAIILICTVQAVASYYSALLMNKFGSGLIADMRKDLYRHIIDNEIEFYSSHDSGNLLSRVTNEIIGISNATQVFFNAWARQAITSAGLIVVMLYQSVELTLISLSALAIAFYPVMRITKRLKKLVRQSSEQNAKFNARLLESFEGIRVIKAFAKEDFEINKVGQYIIDIKAISNKIISVSSLTPTLMQLLAGIAVAFVIWYGGYQLIHDRMTEGKLIAFITSLLMVSKPIRSLTNAGTIMTAGLVNAERFYSILDLHSKYASRHEGAKLQVDSGAIAFQDVFFEYPNGTKALRGVSFTMEAGKKTALVGHSGSGKSTIFNLLLKFYQTKSGVILIDNQDIKEASIHSVRGHIALVSQEIFIFDDTASNNIGYGREGATQEEIIEAAKAAKCHDFIMNMPSGYDTKLGFFGQNLSGGQKQRIAIARAFLRNAPILLLDEATSALDPKTEMEIQGSLEKLTQGRTTIIIAHRLSTVMKASKMIMMDGGTVKAMGTHEELLANAPAYRDLFGI